MKFCSLLKRVTILALLVSLCGIGFAQKTKEKNQKEQTPNSFWLDFRVDLGTVTCLDRSTVPFIYKGFNRDYTFGFTDEWGRNHIHFDFMWGKSTLLSPSGTQTVAGPGFEYLYSCLKPSDSRWHLWAGASVTTLFDFKQIPVLGNASTSFTVFGNLNAVALAQCDFAYDKKDATHPWMTAFFKCSLPVLAIASRPQFAYVQDLPKDRGLLRTLLGNNELIFKPFSGFDTDLGFNVNLRNGNIFTFGYHWDFLTTGKKGAYRYSNAFNTFYVSFMFKL